jgi:hypothetical protein
MRYQVGNHGGEPVELELVHGGPEGQSQGEVIEGERDAEDSRGGLALGRRHVAACLRHAQVQRRGRGRAPDDPGRQDDRSEQGQQEESPQGVAQAPAHGQHVDAVQDEHEEPREAREAGRRGRQERQEEAPARALFDLVQERGDGEEAQAEQQDVVPRLLAVEQVERRTRQDDEGDDSCGPSGQPQHHPVEEQEPDRAEKCREDPDLGLGVPENVHPASEEHEVERAVCIEDDVHETNAALLPGGGDGADLVAAEALLSQREEANRDAGREDAQDAKVPRARPPRARESAGRARGHGPHRRTSPAIRTSLATTLG